MPKSKQKCECVCGKTISASALKRHVYSKKEIHEKIIEKIENIYQKENNAKKFCVICEKELSKPKNLLNRCVLRFFNLEVRNVGEKYCSKKCFHKAEVWNKGLTKDNHPSIKLYAESRKGEKNPIHSILNDEEKKRKWINNIKKTKSECIDFKKGKTYEEIYGAEKAEKKKEKLRAAYYKREKFPNQGKKHSEETKNKIRKATIKQIASGKLNKISKPHQALFDILKNRFPDIGFVLEYSFGFYSLDIAIPKYKIDIEVDGDFWHCNEERGFKPIYKCQKKNLRNDKSKNIFIVKNNWSYIRIWASEIEEDLENVIEKIEEHICLKKLLK